eukprot:gene9775-12404_t
MTPEEALAGVTRHAATALGMGDTHGSLEVGKVADFVAWQIDRPADLAYWLGGELDKRVVRHGVDVDVTAVDKVLNFKQGRTPLLISMPHAGLRLTPAVAAGLIPEAQSLPDTDWHIPTLYDFAAELGASTLAAEYSRFVIDLNRPSDDKPLYAGATTGLFPATLFDGVPLFIEGKEPSKAERATYLEQIWTPYHQTLQQELARLKAEFGYALLFDAHSIRS